MKMKQLFSSSRKWTQLAFARDSKGNHGGPHDPKVVHWCLVGGYNRCYGKFDGVYHDPGGKVWRKIITALKPEAISPNVSVSEWNDRSGRKFSDIKKLVNKLNI